MSVTEFRDERLKTEIAKFPLAQKRQAFSQDGKKLLLSGSIYECQEFVVVTGKLIRTWTRPKEYLFTLGYHGDQPIAVTRRESNDQAMQFWDTTNNNELFTGTGHHQSVSSLLFCPNDVLISGSRDIRVWNTRDQTLLAHSNNTDWAVRLMLMPGG